MVFKLIYTLIRYIKRRIQSINFNTRHVLKIPLIDFQSKKKCFIVHIPRIMP